MTQKEQKRLLKHYDNMEYLSKDIEKHNPRRILFGSSFTFGFLRPETTRMNTRNAIIYNMNKIGFPLIATSEVNLTESIIKKIYSEWWGQEERDKRLTKYLQNNSVLAFLVRDTLSFAEINKEGSIIPNKYSYTGPERFKYLCGSTGSNVLGAGLRGVFGISNLETAIHRSDSESVALQECLLVAPEMIRNSLKGDIKRSRLDSLTTEAAGMLINKVYPDEHISFDENLFWESNSDATYHFLFRNNFFE
ncbi:MAG: hypothetical protein GYA14_01020 [Ignavibacteria bacterium]|nr:hypothetical protein [Ignavibacteria bacterium]